MPQEIEIKLRIENPETIRLRLESCGARRLGSAQEINRIFDTPDGRLLTSDCGLRLRVSTPIASDTPAVATLTYKGPRAAGDMKARDELESLVSDSVVVSKILNRLGYVEKIVYEKQRETWLLGECEILIDELPKLGWFIEIEGPSAADIEAARARLDLSSVPILAETYVEMAANHGRAISGGTRKLMFDD